MPRPQRTDIGNYLYHIVNRANARVQIFDNDKDYKLFEDILEQGKEKFDMRILSYIIMPNHWHLILYPKNNGDLSKFMGWITNTHTRRWHTVKKTTGQGYLLVFIDADIDRIVFAGVSMLEFDYEVALNLAKQVETNLR